MTMRNGTRISKRTLIIGVAAVLAIVVLLLALSNPARDTSRMYVGSIEDFPIDSVTSVILNVHFNDPGPLVIQPETLPQDIFPLRIFVVADAQAGLLALYSRDPHGGCQIRWLEADERFADPCHGSFYTRAGEYIEGPSPRGLDRFPITATEDEDLFIDLNSYQLGNAAER